MSQTLDLMGAFIQKHHVLSLATCNAGELSCCSVFYVYDSKNICFIFASSKETTHIQHIEKNPNIAANILLETDEIGRIEGLQIQGKVTLLKDKELQKLYFKKYPYALALLPTLWRLDVRSFKMTDNKLGFGKKLYYPEETTL